MYKFIILWVMLCGCTETTEEFKQRFTRLCNDEALAQLENNTPALLVRLQICNDMLTEIYKRGESIP